MGTLCLVPRLEVPQPGAASPSPGHKALGEAGDRDRQGCGSCSCHPGWAEPLAGSRTSLLALQPCLVALSPRPPAPVEGLCQGPARWGHSLAWAHSPSALRVFKTLKRIHFRAFLDVPPDGNARNIPQHRTRARLGIEVSVSPGSFHGGATILCDTGGQKDPRELPSLSQECPGDPGLLLPSPEKLRDRLGAGSTFLPHGPATLQFRECRNQLTPGEPGEPTAPGRTDTRSPLAGHSTASASPAVPSLTSPGVPGPWGQREPSAR